LLVNGPEDHNMLLFVDREASDEESLDVLLHDWCHAYAARVRGSAPVWPLPTRYRSGRPDGYNPGWKDSPAEDAEYWRERLAGLPVQLVSPYKRSRPPRPSRRGESIALAVAAEEHRALREVARRHQSTLRMVLQAALAGLLALSTGETNVAIGALRHGRRDESLDAVVGRLSDQLALRFDLTGNPRFGEVIAQARKEALEADERRAPALAHLSVLLELRADSDDLPRLPGLTVTPLDLPTAFDLDLAVTLVETFSESDEPSGLLGALRYSVDVFEQAAAERIAKRWGSVIRTVATAPETSLNQLLVDAEPVL
jgi:nonribosomal peptide synthetase DhbF